MVACTSNLLPNSTRTRKTRRRRTKRRKRRRRKEVRPVWRKEAKGGKKQKGACKPKQQEEMTNRSGCECQSDSSKFALISLMSSWSYVIASLDDGGGSNLWNSHNWALTRWQQLVAEGWNLESRPSINDWMWVRLKMKRRFVGCSVAPTQNEWEAMNDEPWGNDTLVMSTYCTPISRSSLLAQLR